MIISVIIGCVLTLLSGRNRVVADDLIRYGQLLNAVKDRIRQAQVKAILSANAEMILMYWDIGRMIRGRQEQEGWGSSIIPRLAQDIRNEIPEVKGFSERNLKLMVQFFREYPGIGEIGQRPVAQLDKPVESINKGLPQIVPSDNYEKVQRFVAQLSWAHNVLLIQSVKNLSARLWYMQQTLQQGWSRDALSRMIKGRAYERNGAAVTNFEQSLPVPQSELARQLLKDPYIFDFLTLEEPFHERELETGLVRHLEKFLLELGTGFTFVGRQYLLEVSDKEFYLDLLFYHLKLRCFVVIDLKKGDFKPEYTGKMNFYCSVVDDKLKHPTDQPTIGLILCQTQDRVLAEYSLRDIQKPIGVSEYDLTRALPDNLKSSLPTVEEIEAELSREELEFGKE